MVEQPQYTIMEHDKRTYFVEKEEANVKGFTILAADDGEYHIAEKWLASDDSQSAPETDKWMDYWIPEAQLIERQEDGLCEPKGNLTDDQFEKVCAAVEWDYTSDEVEA